MNLLNCKKALQFDLTFRLKTNLLIRTGRPDETLDNTIDTTPDEKLHINGYVWANLFRRALNRLDGGDELAARIGLYDGEQGVSAMWTESSMVDLPVTDTRFGNVISRKWGAATTGLMFNEEIVPPGIEIPVKFNFFLDENDGDGNNILETLQNALWVINEGIENIGGGWSYGFGRLMFDKDKGSYRLLDLTNDNDRNRLFAFEDGGEPITLPQNEPAIARPWEKWVLSAKVADGQLMAIHTLYPMLDADIAGKKLPDAFVYRRYFIEKTSNKDEVKIEPVVTGKAVRQAIFSTEIERRLNEDKAICDPSAKPENKKSKKCDCPRCRWFGSTDQAGIVAVLDAPVDSAKTEIIHRIQLCEHSMQNIHLFSGEYLTGGKFEITVLIDTSREETEDGRQRLVDYLWPLLEEMTLPKEGETASAPPGWYRLGATSTCTGQMAITKIYKYSYGRTAS